MDIVEKRLDEIHPYENNPRKNDEAVEAVANSIKEFGFKQPIVVDSDGVIIVGHTRYKAAQLLGLETVPVLVANDLTEEQARAYRLADNKVSELAKWDDERLKYELLDIKDIDMSDFGFTTFEIEDEEPLNTKNVEWHEKMQIIIDFDNEDDMEETFNRLIKEGYKCRISTL